eukprot:213784_1
MYRRQVDRGPTSYSPNTGSVLFAEPPNWVQRSKYKHPVLYAHPSCFSPLSQASVRGMQETVKSILENNRKQQIKRLNKHKNKHKNRKNNDILIGDHSNEEFSIFVDAGYVTSKILPSETNITPLQIATSEYIGTNLQKYINIVQLLVSYGANIHSASWYTSKLRPEDQEELDAVISQIRATIIVKQKCLKKINELETKKYNQLSDQNERLNDIKMIETLHHQITRLSMRQNNLMQQQKRLKQVCTSKKMVNDSAYVMALKQRQKCNDVSLIEAMVRGSLIIKKAIVKAKGVGNVLNQEIVAIIVEFCNGLSLKLWDV